MSSFTLVAQPGSAMIFPSFVEVAEDLHVTVEEASYCVTIFMLVVGSFPLMIAPFSQIYGRRCEDGASPKHINSGNRVFKRTVWDSSRSETNRWPSLGRPELIINTECAY
jgi:MFS family permease